MSHRKDVDIMPKEKFTVALSDTEVDALIQMTHKGKGKSALVIMHANVLLSTNDNNPHRMTDREVAEQFSISKTTVNSIRMAYANDGLNAALNRKTQITASMISKITGEFEAQVIAAALSPPPKGKARWTLRLLAEHCIGNKYIVTISHTAIGEMLNTNQVKPHINAYWCIPKENDASFVACMEDVLGIYKRSYDPLCPVACMDEKPIQFLEDARERLNAKPLRMDADTKLPIPGTPTRVDSEYIRNGHGSIFIFTEPLAGWRFTVAMDTRKKHDFAFLIKKLLDGRYKHIEKLILISDNLNTHNTSAFYHSYPPQIAYEMSQKVEFHHTPAHGSWLNIAECELSAMARECFGNRRIGSIELLNDELNAWQIDRNMRQKGVKWHFTAENARVKLKRLYPDPVFK